ncbi:MAG: histidine kinase dimerization/phospho-acceptor domain-containing protein [Verrucomicrobiales bacterium]
MSDLSKSELSSLSHDLKSPLTGIQMMLHLLQEQNVGPLNDKQKSMVDRATVDCERLVKVIEQYFQDELKQGSSNRSN